MGIREEGNINSHFIPTINFALRLPARLSTCTANFPSSSTSMPIMVRVEYESPVSIWICPGMGSSGTPLRVQRTRGFGTPVKLIGRIRVEPALTSTTPE